MLSAEPLARAIERERIAVAQPGLPVPPVAAVVFVVQRTEQGVVVEPPALTFREGLELDGARRPRRKPLPEHVKGEMKRDPLQRAHGAKIHGRAPSRPFEPRAIRRVERRLTTGLGELLDVAERDEHRVDGHRAEGGVRRVLPFLHLVDRQQLDQVKARRRQPACEQRQIGDLADAPACLRRNGKERNEHAGVPAVMKSAVTHRRVRARPARRPRTRAAPAAG